MPFCTKCGKEYQIGSVYCNWCGAKLPQKTSLLERVDPAYKELPADQMWEDIRHTIMENAKRGTLGDRDNFKLAKDGIQWRANILFWRQVEDEFIAYTIDEVKKLSIEEKNETAEFQHELLRKSAQQHYFTDCAVKFQSLVDYQEKLGNSTQIVSLRDWMRLPLMKSPQEIELELWEEVLKSSGKP
jgi:zinc-ribbon domain